ncbi:MAG TPA: hypothetical protein VG077_16605 [Verrucomicrobiae bacterium]|nr:hypothetical protein [Verrucomicrobiae bacterium]
MCLAAQEQQGSPDSGNGYELTAIAMVVIGGTNLMGGRGGMGLTLLGVLTIGYLDKILSINAVPLAGRLMLTGLIIVVASKILHGEKVPKDIVLGSRMFDQANVGQGGQPIQP